MKNVNVVERHFGVLTEPVSSSNVLVMAELIALKETKFLIGYMGQFAIKIHNNLYCDIMNRENPAYTLSDSYDLVQTVAVFLCEHLNEYLDDELYTANNGKVITIKMMCSKLIDRAVCTKYRRHKSDKA